jgi:hypothetical protein
VAAAVTGNTLVVATTEYPQLVVGLSPEGMAFSKLSLPQAGTSKLGIIAWRDRVYYTSPDGLVEVAGGAATLITEAIISREYWQALTPATMRLYAYDNVMLVACETKTLLFTYSPEGVTFTESALVIPAAYLRIDEDVLEVVLDGETDLKDFDTGAARTMTWQSHDAYYPMPQKMGAYRVQADGYPLTMRVYADEALAVTVTVTQGKAALLPSLPPANPVRTEPGATRHTRMSSCRSSCMRASLKALRPAFEAQ